MQKKEKNNHYDSQKVACNTNLYLEFLLVLFLYLPTPPLPAHDGKKGKDDASDSTACDGCNRDVEVPGGLDAGRGSWECKYSCYRRHSDSEN